MSLDLYVLLLNECLEGQRKMLLRRARLMRMSKRCREEKFSLSFLYLLFNCGAYFKSTLSIRHCINITKLYNRVALHCSSSARLSYFRYSSLVIEIAGRLCTPQTIFFWAERGKKSNDCCFRGLRWSLVKRRFFPLLSFSLFIVVSRVGPSMSNCLQRGGGQRKKERKKWLLPRISVIFSILFSFFDRRFYCCSSFAKEEEKKKRRRNRDDRRNNISLTHSSLGGGFGSSILCHL